MAELKLFGKTMKEWGDAIDAHELDDQRRAAAKSSDREARKDKIDAYLGRGTPTGNIASRTDFSNEKIGPKFSTPKKVTREKTTVEGDIGSVDRDNPDVIGPNMGQVNKPDTTASTQDMDPMEQARKSMGFKRGGKIKKACGGGKMASGGKVTRSKASHRADGCCVKGHTKGKYL
jgi:hypothetical protein